MHNKFTVLAVLQGVWNELLVEKKWQSTSITRACHTCLDTSCRSMGGDTGLRTVYYTNFQTFLPTIYLSQASDTTTVVSWKRPIYLLAVLFYVLAASPTVIYRFETWVNLEGTAPRRFQSTSLPRLPKKWERTLKWERSTIPRVPFCVFTCTSKFLNFLLYPPPPALHMVPMKETDVESKK